MPTRERIQALTNLDITKYVLGFLFTALLSMATFSGSQVVKAIEGFNAERKEDNKALAAKMDLILAQQAENKTETTLLRSRQDGILAKQAEMEKRIIELELINARNGRR